MFFLPFINDPIPFIIIGGRSGIGKTSIISYLLDEFSDQFEQPKSYTTRNKREEDDRYIFITEDKIKELYKQGSLLNLDKVYGEFYGIASDEILEIKKRNHIPIKEIHPSNFYKFKKKELNTINVLIENKHKGESNESFTVRKGRENEDLSFEEVEHSYDLRINLAGLSSKDAAIHLMKKIYSYQIQAYSNDNALKIDEKNREGYDKLATEFTDEFRITTRNFHDASKKFWSHQFRSLRKNSNKSLKILELGPGNGWLFKEFPETSDLHDIYGLDISAKMRNNYCTEHFCASARNIPIKASYFDLVVGSLADPYLYPETFIELERILKRNGRLIITTPTYQWASNLNRRNSKDQTTFTLQNLEKVSVYSFCNVLDSIARLSLCSTLKLEHSIELFLPSNYASEVSPAIIASAKKFGISEFNLPIVLGLKLIKK